MLSVNNIENVSSDKEYVVHQEQFAGLNMFADESLMSLSESPEAFNVLFDGGALKRTEGFGQVKWNWGENTVALRQLPQPVSELFEFQSKDGSSRGYKNFYFSAIDGNIYGFTYSEESGKVEASLIENPNFSGWEITYFTQYKTDTQNCALLGGPGTRVTVFTEGQGIEETANTNRPYLTKTAIHYSRMFGIGDPDHPQRLWFSKIDEPWNFTVAEDAGGYVEINDAIGDSIDVVSFFDTLYVFCRYGIVAVNAISTQREFSVENIYYTDSEIIKGSVCVVGGRVLFATRRGIYALSGSTVTYLSNKIKNFFKNNPLICRKESSVYFDGCYYLSFHKNDGTSGVLIYNTIQQTFIVRTNVYVQSMAVVRDNTHEKLLVAFEGSSVIMEWGAGERAATSGTIESLWCSPKNDWGVANGSKRIKEIHFIASGDGEIEISVFADGKRQTRSASLQQDKKVFRLPFDIAGNIVGVEIRNSYGANFTVSPITIIYTLAREAVR